MINQKLAFYLIITMLGLTIFQANADEQKSRLLPPENARAGVIDRIDLEHGQLVVDDLLLHLSPSLTVYRNGLISTPDALRAGQRIFYSSAAHFRPNQPAGRSRGMINKVWIER